MKHWYAAALSGIMTIMLIACGGGTPAADKVLSPEEYARAMAEDSSAMVIDVRTPEEYAQGHIEGAQLMNVSEDEAFQAAVDTLDMAHTYYIYCRSGRRSARAASIMKKRGLTVVDLKGGYNAWQEHGNSDVPARVEEKTE